MVRGLDGVRNANAVVVKRAAAARRGDPPPGQQGSVAQLPIAPPAAAYTTYVQPEVQHYEPVAQA